MSKGTIEHANLTVSDPERSAALLCALLGWQVRWRGPAQHGGETIHVGEGAANGARYLALYSNGAARDRFAKGQPLNHVGLLVDDLDAAEHTVAAAGLAPFGHDDYDPGRRFYFFDWDGIEFEMVSYG